MRLFTLLLISTAASPSSVAAFTPCSVCKDGSEITNPEGYIGMTEPVALLDCKSLNAIIPFLGVETDECIGSQALGTICGCPIPEGACRFCGEGVSVTSPRLEVDSLIDYEFIFPAPPSRIYDCEFVEAGLHGMEEGSEMCAYAKDKLGGPCCGQEEEDNVFIIPASIEPCDLGCTTALEDPSHVVVAKINETADLTATCSDMNGMEMSRATCRDIKPKCRCQATCPLCEDGSTVPDRDMVLDWENLGLPSTFDTCGALQDSIRNMDPMDDTCRSSQVFSRLCGCPQRATHCNICGTSYETVPEPTAAYVWSRGNVLSIMPDYIKKSAENAVGKPMSCAAFESMNSHLYDEDDGFCWLIGLQSGACGCENTDVVVLVWTQVGSGIVSALSSLYVVFHVLLSPLRRQQVYYQGMAALSIFTFFGALSYVFATFFMPASGGYYMSIGNDTTCQIQGFFNQLGLTAIFYNMVLSIYFYRLLAGKSRSSLFQDQSLDDSSKKRTTLLILLLALVGIILALCGIPYYNVGLTNCQLAFPPVAYSLLPSILLFMVPVSLVTLVIMFGLIMTCYHYGARSSPALPDRRQLFVQSLNYSLIFMSIWLPKFAQFGASVSPDMFPMLILSSLMTPSQGTLNMLVYIGTCKSCRNHVDKENSHLNHNANNGHDDDHDAPFAVCESYKSTQEMDIRRGSTGTMHDEPTEHFVEERPTRKSRTRSGRSLYVMGVE